MAGTGWGGCLVDCFMIVVVVFVGYDVGGCGGGFVGGCSGGFVGSCGINSSGGGCGVVDGILSCFVVRFVLGWWWLSLFFQ